MDLDRSIAMMISLPMAFTSFFTPPNEGPRILIMIVPKKTDLKRNFTQNKVILEFSRFEMRNVRTRKTRYRKKNTPIRKY
jgi:hypothetical protein